MNIDLAQVEFMKLVAKKGTQKAAADALEISPSLVTEIKKGRRSIPESVLLKLGFERVCVNVRSDRVSHVMKAIEKAAK